MKRNAAVNWLEYLLFRAALFKLRLLPYAWGKWLLTRLFVGVGFGFGIRRRVADKNLEMAFSDMDAPKRRELLKKVYHNLGLTASELYLQPEEKLLKSIEFQGKEHLDKALEMGRGVILATAHFGNWEAARVLPHFGIPLAVVSKKQHNPLFENYNSTLRQKHGLKLIDHESGLKDIMRWLGKNGVVAILTDQNASEAGLIMDFLGSPASHWKGVAKIALRHDVPIVPGFVLRTQDGGITMCFESMIPTQCLSDDEESIRKVTAEVSSVIEAYVRKWPQQWFWVHRRWLPEFYE
ncbi:MAG: lysophospholipid acyltransferase family protein [Candidatus Cloacimonetes bacterium]|nr:lysophospholipid acyltransferase family protein [Candidatus Cloacimonadota bacterium]